MRQDPLQYLADELASLKEQGLYRRLRVLDAEQKARLMEIADKCPVHRTLTSEIRIETSMA